jgi:protein phosphatase
MLNALKNRLYLENSQTVIAEVEEMQTSFGTTIGNVRNENQDIVTVARINVNGYDQPIKVYVLCDGMGGMVDGRRAAVLTASSFLCGLYDNLQNNMNLFDCISKSIEFSNKSVYQELSGNGGATLSTFVSDGANCYIANVGDSRIYALSSDSDILCLTEDDNVKNVIKNSPNISIDKSLINESGLTKFVGLGDELQVSVKSVSFNSKFILATDGLYNLGDRLIKQLFLNATRTREFVQRSIHLSRWLGGYDNASVITIDPQNYSEQKTDPYRQSGLDIWDINGFFKISVVEKVKQVEKPSRSRRRKTSKPESKEPRQVDIELEERDEINVNFDKE